jgi:peptidoglycan hydrolase-like protein with peptidoglycan-binding domain
VTAAASPARGPAPLQTTLTASGDAATYHWSLGDGTSADGPVVQHAYAAGRFTARVTATNAAGETATATVTVTSRGLTLAAPRVGRYGALLRFRGQLVPAAKGARVVLYRGARRVATTHSDRRGRFVVRGRVGAAALRYTARYAGAVSNQVALAVRPGLDTALLGSGSIGRPLVLVVRERPAAAGRLTVRIWRSGRLAQTHTGRNRLRIRLDTRHALAYRVLVSIVPGPGYVARRRLLRAAIHVPALSIGDTGPSVYALEQRLNELHFALARVDGYYGYDTADAVVAFQKLHDLPRTGAVDERMWRELEAAQVPSPRYPGTHVEVSKGRQVLFWVRDSQVQLIVPVSTGATGNTPLGLWHVYSKVPGYNAKEMYYSSFFVGGFAIHGYHSVPTYPASHGCVRMPLWVAVRVYSLIDYGTAVYIYW